MTDLPRADKEQCGAFIVRRALKSSQPLFVDYRVFPTMQRDERVLVVWSDNLDTVIPLCRDFENSLIKLVMDRHTGHGISPGPSISATPVLTSAVNSASDFELNATGQGRDSSDTPGPEDSRPRPVSGGSLWGWRLGARAKRAAAPQHDDAEKGGASLRPIRYFGPVYSGLAMALSTCAVSSFIYGIMNVLMSTRFRRQRSQYLASRISLNGNLYPVRALRNCPFSFCRFSGELVSYPAALYDLSTRG